MTNSHAKSQTTHLTAFAKDTLKGLSNTHKYLLPKYFYDDKGSKIFQDIMHMPEYYLTGCEYDIFNRLSEDICQYLISPASAFQLIELGAGDGLKSGLILKTLSGLKIPFTYVPVDISQHALNVLTAKVKQELPSVTVKEKAGDFFNIMKDFQHENGSRKVVMFLGSNIGNFYEAERNTFLNLLSEMTAPGDKALIGFDLKKSPATILKAYDDPHGHTRDFNLNHLTRINRELRADFNIDNFHHHVSYNPITGATKSYLVSKKTQTVYLGDLDKTFSFQQWEPIFMEISQKFNYSDIEKLARNHGFKVVNNFTDEKNYFTDSLWVRI